MSSPAIDYDALAKQHGAITSAPDYDALAKQHGAVTSEPSWSDKLHLAPNSTFRALTDAAEGAASGAASTVFHGGELIRQGLNKVGIPTEHPINNPEVQQAMHAPDTTSAKIGRFGEQAAEFMGGGELAEGLSAGMKLLPRMAAQGAAAAGVSGIQTGGDKSAMGTAAAMGAGGTALSDAITPVIAAAGRKIQAATIRPRLADMRDGFDWGTIDKLGLTGNLEESLNQVQSKLNEVRNARNALLKPGTANVDMPTALNQAEADINRDVAAGKYAGQSTKIKGAFNSLREDMEGALGTGPVDIRVAENAKEHMGTLGAWAYGRTDPDAQITEKVANTIYPKLKEAIENSLGAHGPEIRDLNSQMDQLLPVKNAMMARIPVEQRNQIFSLQDIASLVPAALTGNAALLSLEGLSRAQKSLRFGNWLSRNADALPAGTPIRAALQESAEPNQGEVSRGTPAVDNSSAPVESVSARP